MMYSTFLFLLAAICLAGAAPMQQQDHPDAHKQEIIPQPRFWNVAMNSIFARRYPNLHQLSMNTKKVNTIAG